MHFWVWSGKLLIRKLAPTRGWLSGTSCGRFEKIHRKMCTISSRTKNVGKREFSGFSPRNLSTRDRSTYCSNNSSFKHNAITSGSLKQLWTSLEVFEVFKSLISWDIKNWKKLQWLISGSAIFPYKEIILTRGSPSEKRKLCKPRRGKFEWNSQYRAFSNTLMTLASAL